MASFASIRTKIKAVLDSITELSVVKDFHESNLDGFPAATFDVSSNEGEFLTNRENLRTIAYTIVIYQEVTVKTPSEAKDILDVVADKVVETFESQTLGNFDLGGEVEWCIPLVGPRGQFQSPNGLVMFQELSLQCKFVVLT